MKCIERDCKAIVRTLSYSDTPREIGIDGRLIEVYRTERLKCDNHHAFEKQYTHKLKEPEPSPQGLPSVKRFHQKDFSGHVVNDYSFQLDKPDPTETNHQRVLRQRSRLSLTPKEGN